MIYVLADQCDEILIENLSPSHHSGESKHFNIWEVECEQEEFLLACRESSLAHVRSPSQSALTAPNQPDVFIRLY